jgi:hypothetical protein
MGAIGTSDGPGVNDRLTLTSAAALLFAALALATNAFAATTTSVVRTYKPVAVEGSTVVFKVRSVAPDSVTRARVRVGGRTHTLSTSSVRTALRRKRNVRARIATASASRRVRRQYRRAALRSSARLLLSIRRSAPKPKASPGKSESCDCGTKTTTTVKPPATTATPVGDRGTKSSPAQPADPGSCPGAFGTFSAANLPGACWRPYADSSPFNQKLPAEPRLAEGWQDMVRTMTGWGKPEHFVTKAADTAGDWVHPYYFSSPSDPVFTVHCLRDWGTCEVEGMQVRIPDAARASGGGDAHMAVIDQASGWEYDFWQVKSKPKGGGTITISWGGRTPIGTPDADGLKSDATAAHFGLLAGTIRFPELVAGKIDHALFFIIKCDGGQKVFPANGHGAECSDGSPAPHQGSRLFLDMSDAEIDAIDAPYWKKGIYRAMAQYGAFVGDTGGSPWGPKIESGSTYTSFGLADPWDAWSDQQEGVWDYKGRNYVPWNDDEIDWAKKLKVADPCVSSGTC